MSDNCSLPTSDEAVRDIELSILMPCLNEAETLSACIAKAFGFLKQSAVVGEVIVADNGSTDGSRDIAQASGARVVEVPIRGYGAALRGGILAAHGRFVIMGDADGSYDFGDLDPFLVKLREGNELVLGNRFKGEIEAGAMPLLHRYLGNPVLSTIGRRFFRVGLGDFHCGLRGFSREAVLALGLRTTGMEYASEMVVRAALADLKLAEVPIVLSKDGRSRSPHLRTWRDGWRHLRFLLLFSPRWLFFLPRIDTALPGPGHECVALFWSGFPGRYWFRYPHHAGRIFKLYRRGAKHLLCGYRATICDQQASRAPVPAISANARIFYARPCVAGRSRRVPVGHKRFDGGGRILGRNWFWATRSNKPAAAGHAFRDRHYDRDSVGACRLPFGLAGD
jgi:glycosyltransferase involved in cell wall biosynthesis